MAEISGWTIKSSQQSRVVVYVSDDNRRGKVELDDKELASISKHPGGDKKGIIIQVGDVWLEINQETKTILFRHTNRLNQDLAEDE